MSSGIGAEIISQVTLNAFDYLDAPPKRISSLDVPLPYAKNLEDLCVPNKENVAKLCMSFFKNN